MEQKQVLRLGAGAVILAMFIRLLTAGFFYPLLSIFGHEKVLSVLFYLETGRPIRNYDEPQEMPNTTFPQETTPPTLPHQESKPAGKLQFTEADMDFISIRYSCSHRPELMPLLTQRLDWNLADGAPAVLIVHSHGSEAYSGGNYTASGDYRTLDTAHNMVSIGDEVARILETGGIRVIHDRSIHDYPNYNTAYSGSRKSVQEYLHQYPSIRLVLDLHRDAADTTAGQLVTSATAGGQKSAQLLMVMGTDGENLQWQENLSLALKLTALLEQTNPGITRPISLRSSRYNQDLSPGSLLVEVGAAGNTHQEAILAANALAQAILELAHGANNG